MGKRGQVTVFIIIGIIVLVALFLVFFFRDKIADVAREQPANTQEYLTSQLEDIKSEIGRCVNKETRESSKLLMENGGVFSRETGYMRYSNVSYVILCKEYEYSEGCLARPISILSMETKLGERLSGKISSCVNLENFRNRDYELGIGSIEVSTQVFDDDILVSVDFPINLTKGSHIVSADTFVYRIDVPLGILTMVVNDLVQIKAGGESINPTVYGLKSMNKYMIKVKKPYPDELYDVSLTSNRDYHFYFAIEGQGRFDRPEGRIR